MAPRAGATTPGSPPSFYPTISPVGALVSVSGLGITTLAVSPQNVGDVLVLAVKANMGAFGETMSGGGVGRGWALDTGELLGFDGVDLELWIGTVTTTGASTITADFGTDVTSVATGLAAQEFSSSLGSAAMWTAGNYCCAPGLRTTTASSTVTFSPGTPHGTDELYFGYAAVENSGSAGTTPGFSYATTSGGDVVAYDTDVSSAVQPTAVQTPAGTYDALSFFVDASDSAPPTVTGVSPDSGPYGGGTTVTITGTNFLGASSNNLSGLSNFTVDSDTQITATTLEGNLGISNVTVTTPAGTSAINAPADDFTFFVPPGPVVTSLSANSGPTAGGPSLTITGTGFADVYGVWFGTESSYFTVNSPTSITATVPPEAVGTVDVTVEVYSQRMSALNAPADQFTYFAPPTVTSVGPSWDRSAGGMAVTLSGSNFLGTSSVRFGNAASTFTVDSDSTITAADPTGSEGTVDVTVITPGGTSSTSGADQFTYFAPPTVTSVAPTAGSTVGGTSVSISGANLTGATAVDFGPTSATSFTVHNNSSISATAPAGSQGTVDVTVTTPGGTSTTRSGDRFAYYIPPRVTGVSPALGPTSGGFSVTISGTNFSGVTAVSFGNKSASGFTVNSATSISATDPIGSAGIVDVTVATPGGTSPDVTADEFTYFATPTITSVGPAAGPVAGGTSVTITGTNFSAVSGVMFGSEAASSFTVDNPTSITATTPPKGASTVDVTVTTPGGTSSTNSGDRFAYFAVPAVTGVTPGSGPITGGTSVVITGANMAGATAVCFGDEPASSFTVNSPTSLTARAPAAGVSTVDVTVTTPGGTSPTSPADKFDFQGTGYWMVGADGSVYAFGGAPDEGSLPGMGIRVNDVVAVVPTADSRGYWMIGSDGGVFAFGDAGYVGSLPALGVHVSDIVGVVPTVDGRGYWMIGSDGGVFAFGDAGFVGSLPGMGLSVRDIVAVVPTSSGHGYWMIGSDGGVFAFGDAGFMGSVPNLGIHVDDIVGAVATASGRGYWMIGSDGGVFAFGDAGFVGSLPGLGVHVHNVTGVVASHDGKGYWMVGNDGGVFAFGDAGFKGSVPGLGVHVSDIVAFARQ
ncbi:MAG TPA: IPT/TIG domain-containing protein [Acidimicrobiales bacterium]